LSVDWFVCVRRPQDALYAKIINDQCADTAVAKFKDQDGVVTLRCERSCDEVSPHCRLAMCIACGKCRGQTLLMLGLDGLT
jgi:hypothetical protein